VRGYQARWFENYAAVPGARANGPWNRRSDQDARNRELFEECVAIIKTAWTHDTFSFKGKYWSYPPEGQRQPQSASGLPEVRPRVDADSRSLAASGQ